MTIVKMHEAKSQLSRLVKDVHDGEEVIIARGNKRVAKLVPYAETKPIRKPGYLKGKLTVADDFDAPLPDEILEAFGCNS
jgi:prevent-host-death family protein